MDVNQFEIAKAPITCSEFAAFVKDGGYQNKDLWPEDVWLYMKNNDIHHPAYWVSKGADRWDLKQFDKIIPLPDHAPVSHVTWYEANAYCHWGLECACHLRLNGRWLHWVITVPQVIYHLQKNVVIHGVIHHQIHRVPI